MDQKTKTELHRWWLQEISGITKKVMAQEDKRQGAVKRRNAAALADYASRDEIIDAYGYGFITEKKKDRLLDLWDEQEGVREDGLYRAKIDLLEGLYQEAKEWLQDDLKADGGQRNE